MDNGRHVFERKNSFARTRNVSIDCNVLVINLYLERQTNQCSYNWFFLYCSPSVLVWSSIDPWLCYIGTKTGNVQTLIVSDDGFPLKPQIFITKNQSPYDLLYSVLYMHVYLHCRCEFIVLDILFFVITVVRAKLTAKLLWYWRRFVLSNFVAWHLHVGLR